VFYLLLTILANVAIFMAFRSFSKYDIKTFPAIITNYGVCVITGVIYTGYSQVTQELDTSANWFYLSIALGFIFIGTFYLMARTTQLRGVSVASVASKMSLAIPVIFSLFILKLGTNDLDIWNYTGIILAFVAILLVSKKKANPLTNKQPLTLKYIALPLAVFLLGGVIDTSLNYANHHFVTESTEPIFPIFIFGFAFIIGLVTALAQGVKFRKKDILGGIYLGVPNYFSIYFQLKALSAFDNNGAILYPSLNIGIIIISTLAAVLLFKEKLSKINMIGVVLAVVVILLLSHQEILKAI
jgi:drug/metabolite transporter (DMT)-like permease